MVDAQQRHITSFVGPYRYYCGAGIGKLLEWMMPAFMFLFFTVMLAGAGAAFQEAFGLPPVTGRVLMALGSLLTVSLGLSGLVRAISPLGMAILLAAVGLSLVSLISRWEHLPMANHILESVPSFKVSFAGTWWQAGLLYGTFNTIAGFPFFAGIGKQAASKKEARWIGIFSGVAFLGAGMLMNLAFLANLAQIRGMQIPFLWIAHSVIPGVGWIYTGMLLGGIYTTAVPLLWSISERKGRTSQSNRLIAAFVTALACLTSQFPFAELVGSVYPLTGYLGIGLFLFMLKTHIRRSR